jgi:hypothetical protein
MGFDHCRIFHPVDQIVNWPEVRMRGLGEGIAFAGLCGVAAWLEISGEGAGGLWVIVVMWAVFTDWGQKKEDS